MRRVGSAALAGLLLTVLAHGGGILSSYYALELRGGSRLYAADKPVRKGKVVVFHRYPDGAFLSLAAGEVVSVLALESAPPPVEGKLSPGDTVYVGGALEGPRHEPPPLDMTVAAPPPGDYGYGYADYGYYTGGGGYLRPPHPGPVPPSRIGPNGFPIIAPPGSPGSVPNPIGSNGYPILAPSPVVVAPPIVVPRPRR